MKNIFKAFVASIGLVALLAMGGCSENIDPVVTELNFTREFSPLKLTARVNKASVQLTWSASSKVEQFKVEFSEDSLQFASIIKTVDVDADQLPLVVALAGETRYSVRVKSVGTNGVADSQWTSITFKTEAEQILYTVDPDDITAFGATIKWPAGEFASHFVLNPGNITREITADEVAAGEAVVSGLTSETLYTVKLMNGTKTRGTMTFTTAIDLGGAIAVYPADDLKAILEAATAGDVFALMPGTYSVQNISISKSISVKGVRPNNKPVLVGTAFRMSGGASLSLKDLVLNGTGAADNSQAIVYDAAATYGDLKIEACEFKNYVKGLMYVNVAALIESVVLTNNIFTDIECNGGDFIDFRLGLAKKFDYINNTANNVAWARDFFRMDAGGSTNFPGIKSVITITNNTFNKTSNDAARRILYIRLASHEITFNKNVLSNTLGYYSNQSSTTILEMKNNNYFNAPNFTGSTVTNAKNDQGVYTTLDPGYSDASSGNFKLSNEDLIYNQIGDSRWW